MSKERDFLIAEQVEEKKRERSMLASRLEQLNNLYKQQMERENVEREDAIRKEGEEALIHVLAQADEERKALEAKKAKLLEERNSWQERARKFNQELQQRKRNNNPPPKLP